MGVREEDEVEPRDGELEELQAKIGGCVDEEVLAGCSIFTDWRRRLLRGSVDVQTAHEHPTTGTPVDGAAA